MQSLYFEDPWRGHPKGTPDGEEFDFRALDVAIQACGLLSEEGFRGCVCGFRFGDRCPGPGSTSVTALVEMNNQLRVDRGCPYAYIR